MAMKPSYTTSWDTINPDPAVFQRLGYAKTNIAPNTASVIPLSRLTRKSRLIFDGEIFKGSIGPGVSVTSLVSTASTAHVGDAKNAGRNSAGAAVMNKTAATTAHEAIPNILCVCIAEI